MAVNFHGLQVPAGATVDIRIEITAPVNVSAFTARQKVTRFVVTEISTQLLAEEPELSVGHRLCWSVPVMLSSPTRGIVGKVGVIAVDATTGELLTDPDTVRRMSEDARLLAERSPL
jgi:hypothetical protein